MIQDKDIHCPAASICYSRFPSSERETSADPTCITSSVTLECKWMLLKRVYVYTVLCLSDRLSGNHADQMY